MMEEESAYQRKDELKPKSITETSSFDFSKHLIIYGVVPAPYYLRLLPLYHDNAGCIGVVSTISKWYGHTVFPIFGYRNRPVVSIPGHIYITTYDRYRRCRDTTCECYSLSVFPVFGCIVFRACYIHVAAHNGNRICSSPICSTGEWYSYTVFPIFSDTTIGIAAVIPCHIHITAYYNNGTC